ncbi:PREDICTED: slit homolog 1 protein-like [Branchiostoma belcheri]|uniref:Slit homolog 1 protein-like n=1 Tax=Branchiostoma belcheri TaxID=7741 RepID=A0A6P4ZPS4_BRABE|nr:PREDICTED: slit homolog 1 protein-like [Branchiostoma belcheri]
MRYSRKCDRKLKFSCKLFVLTLTFVVVNLVHTCQSKRLADLINLGCTVRDFYIPNLLKIHCDNTGLYSITKLSLSLFELWLPNNHLTTFPCMQLPHLSKLVLTNNSITHFPWNCLKDMHRLNVLDLSRNRIFCINLLPVRSFQNILTKVDISHNNIRTLSLCDLGIDVKNNTFPSFEITLGGNPFHCDCDIAWLIDLTKTTKRCQEEVSIFCLDFLEKETLSSGMYNQQSLFRCQTPSSAMGIELYKLDISKCIFWKTIARNDSLKHLQKPCSLDKHCSANSDNPTTIESITLPATTTTVGSKILQTVENTELQQNELHNISQEIGDISNYTKASFMATWTDTISFSQLGNSTPVSTQKSEAYSISVTKMAETKPSRKATEETTGWLLTTIVVVVVVAFCGALFGVYRAIMKKQASENAHINNMAAGIALRSIRKGDNCQIDKVDDEENVYDTIPDSAEPYAKSYTFDVPQYHIRDSSVTRGQATDRVTDNAGCNNGVKTGSDVKMYETIPDKAEAYSQSYVFDVPQYHLGDVPL